MASRADSRGSPSDKWAGDLLPTRESLDRHAHDHAANAVIGPCMPDTKGLLIRGTEITPETRSTLVHDPTHALDDYHTCPSCSAAMTRRATRAGRSWKDQRYESSGITKSRCTSSTPKM